MNQFITLSKNDPMFKKHLLGLSDEVEGRIPVPMRTSNLNSEIESVTFHYLNKETVKRPTFWPLRVIRAELLTLTLFPPLLVLASRWNDITQWNVVALTLLSILFLHASVFCLNDYLDHMGGLDRISEFSGSRAIQNGWLTAAQMRNWGLFLGAVSVIFVSPLLLLHPELLYVGSGILFLMGAGYLFSRRQISFPQLSLCILFLLFGPLLTGGMSWILFEQIDLMTLLYGLFLGFTTVTYVLTKQTLTMAQSQLADVRTFPVILGIDKTKRLLRFSLLVIFFAFVSLSLQVAGLFSAITWIPVFYYINKTNNTLKSVQSPFSSALSRVPKMVLLNYILMVSMLIVCQFIVAVL